MLKNQLKKNFFRDDYKDLLEFLENTDLVVSNLELPFCAEKSLLTRKKFFNSLDNIDLLKIYNINLVSLANNHIDDCGIQGITLTKNILDGLGIKHLGVGQNITEAITPLIVSENGIKFGFIAGCKEGFFNATNNKAGSSRIDEDIIKYLIYDLKKKELCNFVILLFHWGVEFSPFPHLDDRYLAHRFIQLLKEFKYCIYTIFNYGLFNVLSWYREGFRKKINTRVLNLDKCEY